MTLRFNVGNLRNTGQSVWQLERPQRPRNGCLIR